VKQKFLFAGFLVVILCCFLPGCQEPVVEVDPAQLYMIDQYVEELSVALLDTEPDLLGWIREPYADDMPLKYSDERITLLKEHLHKIGQLKKIREIDDFPSKELISKWQVIVVRGDDEWLLEGPEIVEALEALDLLSSRVEQTIDQIAANDGVLDMEQSETVVALTEELALVVEEIRAVFYK
jgi:hypothetical protein